MKLGLTPYKSNPKKLWSKILIQLNIYGLNWKKNNHKIIENKINSNKKNKSQVRNKK
jgi:hypothetical protein